MYVYEINKYAHVRTYTQSGYFENKSFDYTMTDFYDFCQNVDYQSYLSKYGKYLDPNCETDDLPYLIDSFHTLLYNNSKPPTTQEFITYYTSHFEDKGEFLHYRGKDFNKNALTARLVRSYPSLLRDVNALLLLFDAQEFSGTYYCTTLDKKGTDVKCMYKTYDFHLRIFHTTRRSQNYLQGKNGKHQYNGKNVIEWGIGRTTKMGDIFVISQSDYSYLLHTLDEKIRFYRWQ